MLNKHLHTCTAIYGLMIRITEPRMERRKRSQIVAMALLNKNDSPC